jgi:excisionase family DNA binding protein
MTYEDRPIAALSPAEFQRAYGLGQTKFFEMLRTGELKAVKCGRRILIPLEEVDRWASSLPPYRPRVPVTA